MTRTLRSLAVRCAAVCALFFACTGEGTLWYGNGQLVHVPGRLEAGEREGAWLYFKPDGTVLYEETVNGVVRERTGHYRSGRRDRELTEDELGRLVSCAMVLMGERGFRLPPETERLAR